MKLIRWILGRIIIFLDMIFSPKSIIRETKQQNHIDKVTKSYRALPIQCMPILCKG